MNAWAVAFGAAWGVAWGSADSGDTPPITAPPAVAQAFGPMGGVAGPLEQYVERSLHDDVEEMELAQIAALVIRMYA